MPGDILTACLTTPLETALCWHVYRSNTASQNALILSRAHSESDFGGKDDKKELETPQFPGRLNDRKTPLGLLNWILSSVAESIAWSIFDKPMVKILLRQDQTLASIVRNFLLATRILSSFRCTPFFYPLTSLLDPEEIVSHQLWTLWDHVLDTAVHLLSSGKMDDFETRVSDFFLSQMDAFETWTRHVRLVSGESPNVFFVPDPAGDGHDFELVEPHQAEASVLCDGEKHSLPNYALESLYDFKSKAACNFESSATHSFNSSAPCNFDSSPVYHLESGAARADQSSPQSEKVIRLSPGA
jgi:hypothetical protein